VNSVLDADTLIEAAQIGAAAEEHVLAIVDYFVNAGMEVRAGAAAKIASPLDQVHAESALCQSAGRAHPGHAATDDGDGSPRRWGC
jgi:hypothetical protein